MYKYKELFDLSNFPKSSKYYCDENKKIVGKMKDEYGGKSIVKFVGLKSTMHSILDESKRVQAKVTMLLQSFKNFTIHYFRKRFSDIK